MESNLFKYIWRHSWREQLVILVIVLLSQVFYFLSLDLPKNIVNGPIQGKGFEQPGALANFLATEIELPDFLRFLDPDGVIRVFDGFAMERDAYLVALSLTFLLLVFINGGFKLQINTMKGRMGERMLRRLRFELFDRVLRFPLAHFRKVKQAEIATMIKDEVEPLGGFIGDAFVQPMFLGGQALTALVFILAQSFYLGLVTVVILVLQFTIIPVLRKPVLRLGKQRQLTARQLAGRIAECVDGVTTIHVHDASNFERADISDRLGRIFDIRFRLYQLKFVVKFVNNFLAQLTPFLFYLVGGYLVITGDLDVGQLVAVIAAYKDLPGPVKELIDWYQQLQDVQIKYEQVIEQFQPENMLPTSHQAPPAAAVVPLTGDLAAVGLAVIEDGDRKLLDTVTFKMSLDSHVAVAGEGGDALAAVLAGLVKPTGGTVAVAGRDLAELPESVMGRRISYVGPEAYLFPASVRENLLYGLKHQPLRQPAYGEDDRAARADAAAEARRAGNVDFDPQADWVDYAAAGATGPEDINQRLIEVLDLVDLADDVYQFGLRGTIAPDRHPAVADGIIEARKAFRDRLADAALATVVEPFDRDRYNKNMSVAENLLFGTVVGEVFKSGQMSDHPYVRKTLAEAGLADAVLAMGRQIAETMVELFADLPAGHPFFEQFSFIEADDLPAFRAILAQIEKSGLAALSADDRGRLAGVAMPYVEARHRLGLIDEALQERLLRARHAFAANLPAGLVGAIEFYDRDRYNGASTLQDNILFGRLVYGEAGAADRVGRLIGEILASLDLRAAVVEVGLDFQVGIAGKRLTPAQRQKLDIARALLKRPDLLILSGATALLDSTAQTKVMDNILRARRGQGVLWMLHRASQVRSFADVVVLRGGRVVEQGTTADLARPGTVLHELMAAG